MLKYLSFNGLLQQTLHIFVCEGWESAPNIPTAFTVITTGYVYRVKYLSANTVVCRDEFYLFQNQSMKWRVSLLTLAKKETQTSLALC